MVGAVSGPAVHPALVGLLVAAICALHGAAHAAGDPARGADRFAEECGDCHSPAGRDKKGPSLRGVNGRPAASVASFAGYSDALKASGIVWSPEKLDAYIAAPKKAVPGGRMKYDGLPDAAARADVLAFVLQMK